MFWNFLRGLARFAIWAQRFVGAAAFATMAAVGLYDFLKQRRARLA